MRRAELDVAVRETVKLESLLVHEPMMEATEEKRVVEAGFTAVGPVLDVMRVAARLAAAREAAAAVALDQRAAQGG